MYRVRYLAVSNFLAIVYEMASIVTYIGPTASLHLYIFTYYEISTHAVNRHTLNDQLRVTSNQMFWIIFRPILT